MTVLAPPEAGAASAAADGARITVPRQLPARHDGQPLRHLSHSSYTTFLLCPEDWRRRYIAGRRPPPNGAMFLGSRVDDALSAYHQHLLDHDSALTLEQVHDAYRDAWETCLGGAGLP